MIDNVIADIGSDKIMQSYLTLTPILQKIMFEFATGSTCELKESLMIDKLKSEISRNPFLLNSDKKSVELSVASAITYDKAKQECIIYRNDNLIMLYTCIKETLEKHDLTLDELPNFSKGFYHARFYWNWVKEGKPNKISISREKLINILEAHKYKSSVTALQNVVLKAVNKALTENGFDLCMEKYPDSGRVEGFSFDLQEN